LLIFTGFPVMVGSTPDGNADENNGSPSNSPDNLHPDDSVYEVDGWQRGFDVEFHGVGIVELREGDDDDSSDWESDVSEDGAIERPPGYSALASEAPSQRTDTTVTTEDEKSQREPAEQAPPTQVVPAASSRMDEETAASIRNAVAGLKLPAPEWAKKVSDGQLVDLIKKMQDQ
ncbi:hypothetical protein PFISCL1PPCAC_2035, partial [Pristionchus fissidentatus]